MTEALKVLIIEDDPDVALGCEQALQLEGIATECAGSAEQARRRLGRDFRGVVVSDIRLPKMDGMAFLNALRAQPRFARTPVIVISGKELTAAEKARLRQQTSEVLRKADVFASDLKSLLAGLLYQLPRPGENPRR